MARPKSALRKALEEKAAAHAAAAEAEAEAEAARNANANANNNNTNNVTPRTSTSENSQTSTPAPTPAESTTTVSSTYSYLDGPKSETASVLERLSLPGITACNNRDWTFSSPEARECLLHVSPDFEAHWDGYQRPLTFEENIAVSRDLSEKDPNYWMEVVNVSSDVDEAEGEGSVYLEIEVRWTDVKMQGFSELRWRRDDLGKWWCYRHTGMRMTEEHSGFV